jgi:hypothetical protein
LELESEFHTKLQIANQQGDVFPTLQQEDFWQGARGGAFSTEHETASVSCSIRSFVLKAASSSGENPSDCSMTN